MILLALCAFACAPGPYVSAQVKTAPEAVNSSCSRDSALATVRQQVEASKQLDDQVKRIAVLMRAADLLWVHQQEAARGVFAETFELAAANFREKGDEPRRLACKVEELDQRAYLYATIAKEVLVKGETREKGRELLDEMLISAGKAPDTVVKARTLLTSAYLFEQFEAEGLED